MQALTLENVAVSYGSVKALDQTTFALEKGVLCGLIGVNGSGKSTLFKALVGQQTLDSGTIRILDLSVKEARKTGCLSYMPQNEDVDWTFPISVEEVVAMGRYRQMGFTRTLRGTDRAAIKQALARVQLEDYAERQIGQLSGGQKKRVFMARALVQEAEIYLLDEPFAGVDQTSEAMLIDVLRELRNTGKTVLISTHDLQGLSAFATEAILLKNTVLMHGSVAEVLKPENLALAFGLRSEK